MLSHHLNLRVLQNKLFVKTLYIYNTYACTDVLYKVQGIDVIYTEHVYRRYIYSSRV